MRLNNFKNIKTNFSAAINLEPVDNFSISTLKIQDMYI